MSIDPTIAILYAQTGYTSRAAHDAATGPQAAIAMSRLLAQEVAKQEQQQVQSLQSAGESLVTKDDREDEHGGQGVPFGSRRRNRPPPPELEDDEPSKPDGPLVGNLLNLKV